eukprot:1715243-Rhodomonas_salina.1
MLSVHVLEACIFKRGLNVAVRVRLRPDRNVSTKPDNDETREGHSLLPVDQVRSTQAACKMVDCQTCNF